jgi:hypothetical protein
LTICYLGLKLRAMTTPLKTPQEAADNEARILRDLGAQLNYEATRFVAMIEARRAVAVSQRAYAEDERVLAEAKESLETQNR